MTAYNSMLLIILSGLGVLAVALGADQIPLYMWNGSASVPLGLYSLSPSNTRYVGELVAVLPPEPLAAFLADGSYLPRGVPMLKHVLALPGQVEHFFHIHFAGIRRKAIQPETHPEHRIATRSSKTFRQVFRTDDLAAPVVAISQNQLSKLRPLKSRQPESAGQKRIASRVFPEIHIRNSERAKDTTG